MMKNNKPPSVSVSVLNMNFAYLADSVRGAEEAGADSLHMDIMDGVFVDNISFGPDIVADIKKITRLPIYTHLMIQKPERFAERFFQAGSDTVTVHLETLNAENSCVIEKPGMGLSVNPDIPVAGLEPYLGKIGEVLIMSVFAGFGGQKFIPESLEKIAHLKKLKEDNGYKFKISVDGGINPETASACAAAGADEVIVGSYISRADDTASAMKAMRKALLA